MRPGAAGVCRGRPPHDDHLASGLAAASKAVSGVQRVARRVKNLRWLSGSQKNFARYATRIGGEWEKSSDGFNEFYFKRAVARGLLFRATERIVSAQHWYNGGYHFPKEYDRNQASREKAFQRAAKHILGNAFKDLEFYENLKVKAAGKMLTDIDLVVTEKATGVVLLCQLKHQELYGFNLHAEYIRGGRLVKQAQEWLMAVDGWLKQVGTGGLRRALRLPNEFPALQIHRAVIARHFAHQLKDLASRQEALYASWPQLVLATEMASRQPVRCGLSDLVDRLREIPRLQSAYEHQPEGKAKWTVGDLTFMTFQPE